MFDFGPLGADVDTQLLSYFYVSPQATRFVDFSSPRTEFLLVARPGAGKTALRRWLEECAETNLTVTLTHERARLYTDDAAPNIGDLRLLAGVELLTALISEAAERKIFTGAHKDKALEFLEEGWTKVLGRFFTTRFSGLSILGCGFSMEPQKRLDYLRSLRKERRIEAASALIGELATGRSLLLVVDNPEEIVTAGLDAPTRDNALRIGAFLSELARINSLGVRVLCFVKEPILQLVKAHYPDYSHYSDAEESLAWSADDLVAIVESRVKKRIKKKWEEVFSVEKDILRNELMPFLANGPRDLLRLCSIAGKTKGTISLERLRAGLSVLQTERLNDLDVHYRQWPQMQRLVRPLLGVLFSKYPNNKIPRGGIEAAFKEEYSNPNSEIGQLRTTCEWVDRARWEGPPIAERLFLAGLLGFMQGKTAVYPWAGRDREAFSLAPHHFVSPLFDAQRVLPGSQSK